MAAATVYVAALTATAMPHQYIHTWAVVIMRELQSCKTLALAPKFRKKLSSEVVVGDEAGRSGC
jgi:hypothetical protein